MGNAGTRDANKKYELVNRGNVGNVDESVIANDNGELANKGKNKITEDMTSSDGKNKSVNVDPKLNMAAKNTSNKNGRVANNNKNVKGSKSGDAVSSKVSIGDKSVATSNHFDLLSEEGGSEAIDPWNEVKVKVANACDTNVPIEESVLKGWNADMVRFYSVKWNNRTRKSDSAKQQFEREMKSLSSQIAQISRNLDTNSKLNAEMKLKNSDVNVQNNRDAYFRNCTFSKTVWDNLKPLCKLDDLSCVWAEIVSRMSIKMASNSIWSVIQRLILGAAVYYIWQERNFRTFRNNFRTEEVVFRIIVDTVRHKLMGLRIKYSREVEKAAIIWKLPLKGIHGTDKMGYSVDFDGIT
ncbi:reverse transcriptase domain, Reverse transcriptase zinc-binding domain protein [Artemisia annua]|uniref:Reverse transcriptase domain, Reverse transcriptase zinc-binding domain protein n=1 Tax=Artemisia annua TaxID=35608 RepID=A0A2U1MAJ2_ARTAN|nr:reverse transcriptase domain, Reverse transcriptase zinc-binding domain protein [Artemisia annua]